ncbi:hypothetical protein TIFTF001_027921 [Ficus carica]|uniref:AAA+ ATPase domain-containing protein n=1 Tax=Ficus carica TaxID=3494 RepID=A0AA88DNX3_FICCA|nr:hypothetical protein TIFTF001_027921 [Ficus carica]
MGNCISISCQTSSPDFVLSHCVKCISKHTRYVSELGGTLDALKTAFEELTDAKNDLMRRVHVAEQQQRLKRLDTVQRWISRVEAMEAEVNELMLRRTQEVNKLCLWGCCSRNYISSYKFGKKVSEKLAEVTDLQSKGVFEVVAERVLEGPVVEMPLEPTVGLETLFDKVWRDLNHENVGIVGLYGMGGVGKTTLLKKINNNFLETPNDYNVIWVVVSKDHTLENIQNVLGEKIGYSDDAWKRRDSHQKAADIFGVLKRRRFVLLLDDVWERVDLTKLGVPLPDRLNGSKVVFTTRKKDVCYRMHADEKVEVKCLAWDKSWKLFQEMVGEEALNVHPEIPSLAQTVAKECDGLPLALITIGRAMACKTTPQEWNYAIQVLKNSASEFSGMGDEVLPLLKFSYDNLESEKVRSCFLYCALFPEDDMIERNDLIDLWMGEGFLDEYADINGIKNQGYSIIGTLLHACLLEEDGVDHVKMHDVIRDMALWIVSGYGTTTNNSFLVQTKAHLSELPTFEKWNEVSRISLMGNDIESLSGSPLCPNLLTLFLSRNSLCQITDNFFEFMPKLRVLDLSLNWSLTHFSVGIAKLVTLQYLDLSFTGIKEFPRELSNLVLLKQLFLSYSEELDVIPEQIISSFSRLQVLEMLNCGSSEMVVEDSVQCGGNEFLIKELQHLKSLISLRVSIKSVSAFERFLASKNLVSCTQGLFLQHLSGLHFLKLSSLIDLKLLDEFAICHCTSLEIDWGWERLQHSMITGAGCFQKLGQVTIVHCHKLKDLSWLIFVPNLDILFVDDCSALEEIIHLNKLGDGQESINVRKCAELKKLPISSEITKIQNLTIQGEESWWNELEWEDVATRDALLPCFRALRN